MRTLPRNQTANVMVFMTSTDHVAGAAGLTLTVTLSKNGAAFASITPTVTERNNGWYSLSLGSADIDTLGDLALHVTATGADPTDVLCQVVAYNPADAAGLGLSRLDVAIGTRLAASSYVAPDNATLALVAKILRNKTITDPVAGTLTVFDDDGIAVLLTAPLFENAGGTIAYKGNGAERRERLA